MTLKPTPLQLAWQRQEMGMFIHFGLNTMFGKEWSDGTLPPSSFDPGELDTREWVRNAVMMGARYVVLTAKHHDGFCLWPTATTDYSVTASPWRDGNGDVVGELAKSCREAGIGLGLYLSPWDRNAECYSDHEAYSDFYATQLTELCTRYGPLVELWFDGAGSEGYKYDWERIMAVVQKHQPNAMIFNMGAPTIRWIGNENGLAEDPVEYTVGQTQMSNYTVATTGMENELYLPPECDVSIRRGWFWHPDDEAKSVEHLLAIYYRSVGMGANLLLNVPPDRTGRLDPADVDVIRTWRDELDRRFAHPIEAALEKRGNSLIARFDEEIEFDHLRLVEELHDGQRVARHRVLASGDLVAEGQSIGSHRLHVTSLRSARELEIVLEGDNAILSSLTAYRTGTSIAPRVPDGYVAPTTVPED